MEKAIALANELVREVLNSACYKEYMKAYSKIKQSPELLEKITEFKERHLDFQTKKMREGNVSFEEEKFVSKLYSDLYLHEDTRNFIERERNYFQLVEGIFSAMSKINAEL